MSHSDSEPQKEEKNQKKEYESVPPWAWNTLVAICLIFFIVLWISSCDGKEKNINSDNSSNTTIEYPRSGYSSATIDKPIEAYIDPSKSYTKVIGGGYAKFVYANNQNKFWICNESPESNSEHMKEYWRMPKGNYLIYLYPREGYTKNEIDFSWHQ
ncbi:MAG: hypothetical protein NDI62_02260 [Burkholderiales bacterium]|nr:hypothetical protein [Burkholderiales bacterium]